MRTFASDNYAGVHPDVLATIAEANDGHAASYGADPWTARFEARIREQFGEQARGFLVFNGTAANVLSVISSTRAYEGVICAQTAHLNVDEGGAPERIAGTKLLTVATPDGKLTPELAEPLVIRIGDEHAVQPRLISVTQSTELGTRYTAGELRALAACAHDRGLLLHVDGARLANAAAGLGVELREITTDVGVDLLSFGATKNGGLGAEAVVFLREGLGEDFKFVRKQSMQLASKMRFAAAQYEALLADGLWRRLAGHANAMATRLAGAVRDAPGVTITQPVQANGVFAILPAGAVARLQERFFFYVWDEHTGEVRWMCAWDTTPEDVDAFAAAVHEVCSTPV